MRKGLEEGEMFLPHPSQSREGVSASGSPGLQVLRAEVPGAVAGPLGTAAATALAPRGLPAGKVSRATQAPAALCLHCDRLCRAPRAAHPMKFGVSAEQTGPVLWCERGAAAPLQPCLQGGCGQVPITPSEQGEGPRSKHSLV